MGNTKGLLLLVFMLVAVANPLQATASGSQVAVSTKPIHSLVVGLMKGVETPALLIDGGVSPFDYQPTEQQLTLLANTRLLIWTGEELEPHLSGAIARLGDGPRIIELLSMPALKILPSRGEPGQRDPFFWLDSRNAVILIDQLTQALVDMDPSHAHSYLRNRERVLGEVARLDRELEYGYRGLNGDPVVLYYDTLQYFEQAYAFRTSEIVSASPLQPTDTERLLRARMLISDGRIGCILTEAGLPAPHLSILTGDGADSAKVMQLDSLGINFAPGAGLYTELMNYNSKVLSDCAGGASRVQLHSPLHNESDLPQKIQGRFMLVNQYGELVTDQNLLGRYQLLYFGYTFCPDVCPTSLAVISQVLDGLGEQSDLFQPYFITIDPERDTVEVMRNYVRYFNDKLIGLTGSKPMIARVAKQYRVNYEKVTETGRDPELYLMDHSPGVYLIAPDGTFVTKFAYGISATQMMAKLRQYVPELASGMAH